MVGRSDKQHKVVIAKTEEGVARLRVAKVLRSLKSISLSEALDLIDSAPCPVYEGPKTEADRVAKELSQAGANMKIDEIVAEQEPKSETKCKIHNKEAVDTCMSCGQPACEICLAEEGNNWYCSKCFSGSKQISSKGVKQVEAGIGQSSEGEPITGPVFFEVGKNGLKIDSLPITLPQRCVCCLGEAGDYLGEARSWDGPTQFESTWSGTKTYQIRRTVIFSFPYCSACARHVSRAKKRHALTIGLVIALPILVLFCSLPWAPTGTHPIPGFGYYWGAALLIAVASGIFIPQMKYRRFGFTGTGHVSEGPAASVSPYPTSDKIAMFTFDNAEYARQFKEANADIILDEKARFQILWADRDESPKSKMDSGSF